MLRRCLKRMMKRKQNGAIAMWIMLVIALFFLTIFFVKLVGYVDPMVRYIKLNQLVRHYTLQMEKEGYLSPSSITAFKNDLSTQKFNPSDIVITNNTTTTKVSFGENVTFEISYTYIKKDYVINGLHVTKTTERIPMIINKSTTSKNAS